MFQCNVLDDISIEVSTHKFSWVVAYLDFGFATSDNNPLLIISGCKGVK